MKYNFKIYCYFHNPNLDAVSICKDYTFKEIFREAYSICRRNFPFIQDALVVLDDKEMIFDFKVSKYCIEVIYKRATNSKSYISFLKFFP